MDSPKIFAAVSAVMGEINAVGKTKKNAQQGYSYRGIDDVYLAVNAAMVRHGIFTVPKVIDMKREEKPSKSGGTLFTTVLTMEYTFYAVDGSSVQTVVIGEGMDSGDKASNKAMSVAQKYAFIQVFAIPTEEPKDPEIDSPEPTYTPKATPSVAASIDPGGFVTPFGTLAGKKIADLTDEQIRKGIAWCTQPKQAGRYDEWLNNADAYLKSLAGMTV
jgi:hypothetical protein